MVDERHVVHLVEAPVGAGRRCVNEIVALDQDFVVWGALRSRATARRARENAHREVTEVAVMDQDAAALAHAAAVTQTEPGLERRVREQLRVC